MKKLVFSISLILSYTFIAIAGVVKSIPAKADEFTNGNIVTVTPSISETDLTTYNNALQVLEYLRQGGTIDFSNVSDDYQTGDLLNEFVDLIDTVGSGIDYYGNNFLNNLFNLSSDTVQLSPNTKLKDRIGQFRSNLPSYLRTETSEPIPNPDPDFSFISNINSLFFGNININSITNFYLNYSIQNPTFINPLSEYTLVSGFENANQDGFTPYHSVNNYFTSSMNVISALPKISIYLTTNSDNTINVNYSNFQYTQMISEKGSSFVIFHENATPNGLWFRNYTSSYGGQLTSSYPSLSVAINNIYKRFYNINLFVDGDPWVISGNVQNYSISLGTGTYLKDTNQPIEYKFEIPVYVDISDLIDKIQLAIDNKITLDFPYLNDLIVDTNGQQTIAVTVFSEDYTIDDLYIQDYGAMIPLFPLWVEYPVALEHINTVATVGIVDVIPEDIIEVLGIFLIVGLFVFLCHRLME